MPTEWFCAKGCTSSGDCEMRSEFDGTCVFEYDAKQYEPHLRWKGEGDPPPHWRTGNTIVYRTFADYCD